MKYRFGLRGHDAGNSFEEMCENAKKSGIKNLQFALAKTVSEINFDEVGCDADLSKKKSKILLMNIIFMFQLYPLLFLALNCTKNAPSPNRILRYTDITDKRKTDMVF